ncbi:MAG: hypothetical protein ACTSYL_12560 [Candidatus Thorarchaeota archaeon]
MTKTKLTNSYLIIVDQLKKIDPEPLITKDYAVVKSDDVIVFTTRGGGMIYLLKFDLLNAQPSDRIVTPRIFRKCQRIDIAEFRLYQCEGRYSIPTPDNQISTVDCVLYVLPGIATNTRRMSPVFRKSNCVF